MFNAGITTASFDVPIINDNVSESDESFNLTIDQLSLPDRVGVSDPNQIAVIIEDDDGE